MNIRKIILVFLFGVFVWSCQDDDINPDDGITDSKFDPAKDVIVPDKKEIRAAWIATVGNYDWPITKSNPTAQKSELTDQLSRCQTLNFNAVILQIRPVADAFYPSELEPWSVYLTGVQGQDPGYDPLKFAIEESHRLGMEFHAWLNPYRIGSTSAILASSHVAVKNPSWVVTYNNVRYFNPGLPEVRAHLMAAEVSQIIKANKPGVLFGISPSGRRENSIDLYADPFVWLDNKWVDYLAPQIYWEFGHSVADFGKQASFWNTNARGVPIVVGIAAYKFKDTAYPAYGSVSEIDRQIEEVRKSANLHGCFYFRMKFLENAELFNFLKTKYIWKSVLPVMGKLTAPAVGKPVVSQSGLNINWASVSGAKKYVVYLLEKDKKINNTFNAHVVQINSEQKFTGTSGMSYFVTALNEDQIESDRSNVFSIK